MKKDYIKMNNNEDYLSLGNLFRVIKEESKNKTSALQSFLFSILFDDVEINETTINNYCVGIRRIGDDYKQIFLNKQKKYEKDHSYFVSLILAILTIMDGTLYKEKDISFINNNSSMQTLVNHMYNIAKNDQNTGHDFIANLYEKINKGDYYEAFVEILFYVVLIHKQPLYIKDLSKRKIENILQDSCMSYKGLEDYLVLTFNGNVNHDFVLKKLAKEGNVYANYEMGSKEYLGHIAGYPRYIEAYEYLIVAADSGHAGALYMIGAMFYRGFIGDDKNRNKLAFDYFNKAINKGNVAALNSLGLMYLRGDYVKKDKEKAIELFKKAAEQDCVYAYNNLGHILEDEGKINEAFSYYLKSALLGESWACNQVGEWYRLGIGTIKSKREAFLYYNKALEADYKHIDYYAYFNLAQYYYFNGDVDSGIKMDISKYLEYMNIAFQNDVLEAGKCLFLYYVNLYYKDKDESILKYVYMYKEKLENHQYFTEEMQKEIDKEIKKIKGKFTISFEK